MFFDIRYELKYAEKFSLEENPSERAFEGEVTKRPGFVDGHCIPGVWKNNVGGNNVFCPGFQFGEANFYFMRLSGTSKAEAVKLANLLAASADNLEKSELSG